MTQNNTLGQLIGKVRHSFRTTNNAGESVTTTQVIDFTTADDNSIKSWLCGNRAIARQRPMKPLSAAEMEALNGKTFKAETAGCAIESDTKVVEKATTAFENMTKDQQELYIAQLKERMESAE
jgi:hypothetical protein